VQKINFLQQSKSWDITIEFSAIQQDYTEKIYKAQSDKFGSLSMVATGQGDVAKLQNQYASYAIRSGMYYVIAPQSGTNNKARKIRHR
jgi:hypothetical protein